MANLEYTKKIALEEIHHIASYLILNHHKCSDLGLYYGKTGISIFFFHIYKYTSKKIFSEIAFQYMEDIQSQINLNTLINYERGLSGIGTGIQYLIRNKLIEGDINEILEDFDEIIVDTVNNNIYNIDLSIATGLCGLGKYLIQRKLGLNDSFCNMNKKIDTSLDTIISKIDFKIKNELFYYKTDYLNPVWRDVLSFLIELSKCTLSGRCRKQIETLVENHIKKRGKIMYPQFKIEGQIYSNFGLYKGYSGRGLKLLQTIDKTAIGWNKLL